MLLGLHSETTQASAGSRIHMESLFVLDYYLPSTLRQSKTERKHSLFLKIVFLITLYFNA
jgi:hypothetical protein